MTVRPQNIGKNTGYCGCGKEDRVCKIIDVAEPDDCSVNLWESEKIEKCQDFKREISTMSDMRKVEVTPVVVGALEYWYKGKIRARKGYRIIRNCKNTTKSP